MPKSLVEKLAEVVRSVDGLKKLGDNGEYAYLRILDIADALRDRLFAAGILIIPSDVECELNSFESEIPGRRWTEAKVKTEFTITDGTDVLDYRAFGFARDMDAKCVSIAQTAALKAFLKRLSLIFGEYDDPEIAITERKPWKKKEQIAEEWKDVSVKNAEVVAAKAKTKDVEPA